MEVLSLVEILKAEKLALQKTKSHLRTRLDAHMIPQSDVHDIDGWRERVRKLEEQVKGLDLALAMAEDQLCGDIETLRDVRFTDDVCECCMVLLSHNAGVSHVSGVIQTIVECLTKRKIGRLPSVSKMTDFLHGISRQISLAQLGE